MRAGDLIANRFEISAQAGSGGMGVVFRGVDRHTGQEVAIKCLHQDVARDALRFDQEAALLAGFNHPAIVRYVAHGRSMGGSHYLVMEWLDGQSLASRLDVEGLTLIESVETIRRVAEGIAFAHRQGVVHRDIKPNNIIFPGGQVDRVKIIDFGIALRTHVAVRFTESGTVLGTPSYMAPEQARASKQVDARTDVFSLGCVLFECLTGNIAFAGSNPLAVRAKALVMQPPACSELMPHVPVALDTLVGRMLSKEPDERPAHAGIVADELAALSDLPVTDSVRRLSETSQTERIAAPPTLATGTTENTRPLSAIIMCAIPEDYAHLGRPATTSTEVAQRRIADAVRGYGAHVEMLDGRSSMVILAVAGSPTQQAAHAAHCALSIRDAFPELALVLTIGDDSSIYDAIDRSARTMEVAVRRAILDRGLGPGPVEAGAIRLDPFAAGMLGPEFFVERAGSKTYYLHGYKDRSQS